jgi:hypothetical protein
MFYDGVRLKWLDHLENVKRIVCQVWGHEGKWSSPGGQTKKFTSTNADLLLTWYKGKQNTLIFQGKDVDIVRDRCIFVCKQESHLNLNQSHNRLSVMKLNTLSQPYRARPVALKADFQSSHEAPRSSLRVMHEHFHPITMLNSSF